MPPWPRALRASALLKRRREFSTRSHSKVNVRCGSEGFVTVDLYNVTEQSPSAALVVHLPSHPSLEDSAAQLPGFLQDWPVASINYRWETVVVQHDGQSTKFLRWPIPVHDTAFAFHWIIKHLAPPNNGRRDIYVYGSHLGASLATSLSLTETHAHTRFGIRGFIAYNGIYNWTMFLPDHRINKTKPSAKVITTLSQSSPDAQVQSLQERLPSLFELPSNLFDPFASPSLFFHSPGLSVPKSFYASANDISMIDAMASRDQPPTQLSKPPRKSHLIFPPRQSTLRIPQTLLLHDSLRYASSESKGAKSTRRASSRRGAHTFEAQASELAGLMRRSVDVVELTERRKWDDDIESLAGEPDRRVQVVDVGWESNGPELGEAGQDIIQAWLRERASI